MTLIDSFRSYLERAVGDTYTHVPYNDLSDDERAGLEMATVKDKASVVFHSDGDSHYLIRRGIKDFEVTRLRGDHTYYEYCRVVRDFLLKRVELNEPTQFHFNDTTQKVNNALCRLFPLRDTINIPIHHTNGSW